MISDQRSRKNRKEDEIDWCAVRERRKIQRKEEEEEGRRRVHHFL
jgi:hypothetical protein